ncbi:MAG: hypothetical protein JO224_01920 [Pelomonas sp.]|nr:hypothetical protein [Roseateles sp.]
MNDLQYRSSSRHAALLAALCAVASACAAGPAAQDKPPQAVPPVLPTAPASAASGVGASDRARAWADIEALVGDANCSADAQCHVVGVGARACGGPARYIAWSSRMTDADQLDAAVQRHAALEREALKGRVSNCLALPEPVAQCRPASGAVAGAMAGVGRCVIVPGARPRLPE